MTRRTASHLFRRALVLPIRFYQRAISPLTPPSCRFEPSCSEYGARAVLAHGLVKGSLLGAWRVLRCHPFTPGGLDPVPAPGRWKAATDKCAACASDAREADEPEGVTRR